MTNEQFEKLYNLLTSACVGIWLIMVLVFLFFAIYFINLYYDEKEKKDKISVFKSEERYRDKIYLSNLEHRIRDLENRNRD